MSEIQAVVDGAFLKCTLGVGRTRLHATTIPPVMIAYRTLATIKDNQAGVNVPPFNHCKKLGGKCVPVLSSPWKANLFSNVMLAPSLAGILPSCAKLHCEVGGDIFIVVPGQSTVSIGEADRLVAMEAELRQLLEEYQRFLATGELPPEWELLVNTTDGISSTLKHLDLTGQLADKLKLPKNLKRFLRLGPFGLASAGFESVRLTRDQIKLIFNEIRARNIDKLARDIQRTRGNPSRSSRRGGPYGRVRRETEGGEVHHMPSVDASPLSVARGPAISMDVEDHSKTASHGRVPEARAYRAKQKRLIEQGRFQDAQQMDIDDIHEKFGSKYDDAIEDMLEYTEKTPTR
ncbi:MAG: DUF4280 domain-containing protein [Acidobacteria bacterium]|nr:DUF4280 domain-containing protein [Acidobacteriota bacterium]